MKSITPISETVAAEKDQWESIGRKILAFHGCGETTSEIGRCIDLWKTSRRVPEGQMIDGLGFLLGDLVISMHGGSWVWVVDEFGQTAAIQRISGGNVCYVLDLVSKRLCDNSIAELEIPSVISVYADL